MKLEEYITKKPEYSMVVIFILILIVISFVHLAQYVEITRWKTIYKNLDKFEFSLSEYDISRPGVYVFKLFNKDKSKVVLKIYAKENFTRISAIEKVGDEDFLDLNASFPIFKHKVAKKLRSMVPEKYLITEENPDKFENYL